MGLADSRPHSIDIDQTDHADLLGEAGETRLVHRDRINPRMSLPVPIRVRGKLPAYVG